MNLGGTHSVYNAFLASLPASGDSCWPLTCRCNQTVSSIFTWPYSPCVYSTSFLLRTPVVGSGPPNSLGGFPGGSVAKNHLSVQETWVQSLGWDNPLEKEMATHSSILAWRIPWIEESGGLPSMGSQRVRQDWATKQQQQNSVWPLNYLLTLQRPY